MFSVKRPTPAGVLLFARVWLHVPVAGSVCVCVCVFCGAGTQEARLCALGGCLFQHFRARAPSYVEETHSPTDKASRICAFTAHSALGNPVWTLWFIQRPVHGQVVKHTRVYIARSAARVERDRLGRSSFFFSRNDHVQKPLESVAQEKYAAGSPRAAEQNAPVGFLRGYAALEAPHAQTRASTAAAQKR